MKVYIITSILLLFCLQAKSQRVLNTDTSGAFQDSVYYSKLMTQYSIGDTLYRSFVYDRNFFGRARKSTVGVIRVVEKSHYKLKVEVISFGGESNSETIYSLLECDSTDCWLDPHWWQHEEILLE